MSEIPPRKFVAYPRENSFGTYGSVAKLEALGQAYFGLNLILGMNILSALLLSSVIRHASPVLARPCMVLLIAAVGILSYFPIKKIGMVLNWSQTKVIVASCLMGLNSLICFGIIAYNILVRTISYELNRYGIRKRTFGYDRSEFAAALEERRNSESMPPVVFPNVDPL
jgi:hypothetical protein